MLAALAQRPDCDRLALAYEVAVEIASAVEMIRGYETVKERNVERYRARVGGTVVPSSSTCWNDP